jgi:class 3 adenylate cyclase/tetratricopeptide (TPR) repeat protein
VRTEERRVVTVLFADLVGFTGLSQDRDPEQVKHLVDSCFQRLVGDITAFGGTVDKIIGDGIIALFGAPTAHEDDPERAVRAALRMQRTIGEMASELNADIRMRIGVNTGEVVVGAIRAGGDYTAMGDTVNVASRLETVADPGEVIVGPGTVALTSTAIRYEPRGAVLVRGREVPVEVSVAMEELVPPGRRRRMERSPLAGRNLELMQLTSAIDTSITRRRAHLTVILGEAGVGKSRLAEEVAAAAEVAHGALALKGRALPYGETNAFRPMAEALRQALGVDANEAASFAVMEVADAVERALGATVSAQDLSRVTNGLLHLFGYSSPVSDFEPARARDEVTWAVTQFLQGSARERPVVLTLGDVHWADGLLMELVERLLVALVSCPFVVIATARWNFDEDRWVAPPGRHNTTVMNLDSLDAAASARVLRSILGQELSDDVIDLLHNRAGGNPFFLEELAGLLLEAGAMETDAASLDGELVALPDTLRGLVAARIDALDKHQRSMVEDAAVVGRVGPVYALLLMAKERGSDDGEHTFQRLVEKEILVPEGEGWKFRSDLVRDIAYQMMTKTVRAIRHVMIADWLVDHYDASERGDSRAGLIAQHYRAAAEVVPDIGPVEGLPEDLGQRAVEWLMLAGRKADARDSNYASARFFAQALELMEDDDPRQVEILLGRANARLSLRELPGARSDAETALSLSLDFADSTGEAHALTMLGQVSQAYGSDDVASGLLTQAVDKWKVLGDESGLAEALRLRGLAHLQADAHDLAEQDFADALAMFTDLDDPVGEAWCQQNLAWLSFELGRTAEAEERLERSCELFTRNDDMQGLSFTNGLLAFVRFHQGRRGEAEQLAARTLALAVERGERFGEAMMVLLLGSLHLWQGRARQAIDAAERARELFERIENQYGVVQSGGLAARSLTAVGRFDDARAQVESLLSMAKGQPAHSFGGFASLVGASCAVQRGDGDTALAMLEGWNLDPDHPELIGTVDREVTRGLAMLQSGRIDEGVIQLEDIKALVGDDAGGVTYADSSLALGLAAHGRDDEAFELAERVLESDRGTYLDRRTAAIAMALIDARRGDTSAFTAVIEQALSEIDATDSRMSQAVVRMARAVGAQVLGLAEAEAHGDEATVALAELGVDGGGWSTLFGAVAHGRPAAELGASG